MGGGSGSKRYQRNHGGDSISTSKKGRTVDMFFCPFCGNRYKACLRRCQSPKCEKILFITRKCGNCHLPRERQEHQFCRFCGLNYDDVGLVEPIKIGEPIIASTKEPVLGVTMPPQK